MNENGRAEIHLIDLILLPSAKRPWYTSSMSNLPMSDLLQVLVHITTTKHADLVLTPIGQALAPSLKNKIKLIDALPEPLRATEPYARELEETDDIHDAFHEASEQSIEAALVCPTVSEDDKSFLLDVKSTFVGEAAERRARFVDEAENARKRRAKLPDYEVKLKAWTVAPGHTLYDWIDGMVRAGESLHSLLGQRADAYALSRKEAIKLRGQSLGILKDLRRGIRRAVEEDPTLPRDLEARLFSHYDTLNSMQKKRVAAKAEGTTPPPAAAAPVPSDPQ